MYLLFSDGQSTMCPSCARSILFKGGRLRNHSRLTPGWRAYTAKEVRKQDDNFTSILGWILFTREHLWCCVCLRTLYRTRHPRPVPPRPQTDYRVLYSDGEYGPLCLSCAQEYLFQGNDLEETGTGRWNNWRLYRQQELYDIGRKLFGHETSCVVCKRWIWTEC